MALGGITCACVAILTVNTPTQNGTHPTPYGRYKPLFGYEPVARFSATTRPRLMTARTQFRPTW